VISSPAQSFLPSSGTGSFLRSAFPCRSLQSSLNCCPPDSPFQRLVSREAAAPPQKPVTLSAAGFGLFPPHRCIPRRFIHSIFHNFLSFAFLRCPPFCFSCSLIERVSLFYERFCISRQLNSISYALVFFYGLLCSLRILFSSSQLSFLYPSVSAFIGSPDAFATSSFFTASCTPVPPRCTLLPSSLFPRALLSSDPPFSLPDDRPPSLFFARGHGPFLYLVLRAGSPVCSQAFPLLVP